MIARYTDFPFIQAARYTKVAGANLPINRIVIHDMEAAETATTAEAVANMFRTTTREASAHFCIDSNSIVGCVPLDCIAWHAPPNSHSIGLEHAGYVRQRRLEWLDSYGVAMLTRSAALTARLCKQFSIPVVRLSAADLRAGKRGICGHDAVSAAWRRTDHTDPAPNFPWDWYIPAVKRHFDGGAMATLDSEDIEAIGQEVLRRVMGYELPGLIEGKKKINVQTVLTRGYRLANEGVTQEDVDKLAAAIAAALRPKA